MPAIDPDLKRCAQCGRQGVLHFTTIPSDDFGGPEITVCQGRIACRRRWLTAQARVDDATEKQSPSRHSRIFAEELPTGTFGYSVAVAQVRKAPTSIDQAQANRRALEAAIGLNPQQAGRRARRLKTAA